MVLGVHEQQDRGEECSRNGDGQQQTGVGTPELVDSIGLPLGHGLASGVSVGLDSGGVRKGLEQGPDDPPTAFEVEREEEERE